MEMYGKKAATGINWVTTIFMGLFHVGAFAALFFFDWKVFFVTVFLWWLAYGLGIGVAYHRLLTHRGFKTPKWFEYFITTCATLALEGGPIFWVATHRIHHQKSDRDGDPHSPREGAWWAHAGWIIHGKAMHHETSVLNRYVPDLAKDQFHIWITKFHYVPQIVLGLALMAFGYFTGGWWMATSYVLWGIFMRVTFGLHATWLVNSATHMFGSRRFKTRDDSTNSWWVALFTFGEGWHNNHHAHPTSARHGLAWYEVDFNWMAISVFTWLGIIRDVKQAKITQPVPVADMLDPQEAQLATSAGYD